MTDKITVEFVVSSFSSEGDDIIVSGVYAECGEAAAREAAYRLYLAPDNLQHQLLSTTLDARHEMATICGFQSYADRYELYSHVVIRKYTKIKLLFYFVPFGKLSHIPFVHLDRFV